MNFSVPYHLGNDEVLNTIEQPLRVLARPCLPIFKLLLNGTAVNSMLELYTRSPFRHKSFMLQAKHLLELLVNQPPSDLQALTDAIASATQSSMDSKIEFAFYSPDLRDKQQIHQICSSSGEMPKSISLNDRHFSTHSIKLTFFRNNILFLVHGTPEKCQLSNSAIAVIELHCNIILFQKRQKIRHGIARISLEKSDENSFSHKVSDLIRSEYINCDHVTIFLYIEDLHRVVVSSSTHKLDMRKDKFAFPIAGTHSSAKCIQSGEPLISYGKSSLDFPLSTFLRPNNSENEKNETISVVIWPIRFISADSKIESKDSRIAGAIQINNIKRKCPYDFWYSHMTEYDSFIIDFVSEALFIIIEHMRRVSQSQKSYRVFSHGILSSIEYAQKQILRIHETLFSMKDKKDSILRAEDEYDILFSFKDDHISPIMSRAMDVRQTYKDFDITRYIRKSNPEDIFVRFVDIVAALDDIQFHFDKVSGIRISPALNTIKILPDVLIPLTRIASSMARYRGKPAPKFNSFDEAGFKEIRIPSSNENILLSVVRNLLENSIKYCAEEVAAIELTHITSNLEFELHYRDNSIGIENSELELIFRESYRGIKAMQMDNDGIGWGLNYCIDALEHISGKIRAEPSVSGAHFIITLPLHGDFKHG